MDLYDCSFEPNNNIKTFRKKLYWSVGKKLFVLLLLAHSFFKSSNINSKETKIDNRVNTKYLCKPIHSDNRTKRLFHNAFSYSQPFSPHIREIYKSKNNKHCLMTSFKQSLLWNQSLSLSELLAWSQYVIISKRDART